MRRALFVVDRNSPPPSYTFHD